MSAARNIDRGAAAQNVTGAVELQAAQHEHVSMDPGIFFQRRPGQCRLAFAPRKATSAPCARRKGGASSVNAAAEGQTRPLERRGRGERREGVLSTRHVDVHAGVVHAALP